MMDEHIFIGEVKIEKTAALSPMASVADRPYRIMAKSYGASYLTSEMVSAKGLVFDKNKRDELLEITDFERPMAIQLFGSEPEYFLEAVKIVNEYRPDIIDINMGCPVKKVVSNGAGAALMKDVDLSKKILQATLQNAKCPVTVKIRKGYDNDNINALYFAKQMEKEGAAAITVHGRTKEEMYSKECDFEIIKRIKEEVNCPIIASGDIKSACIAKEVYDKTKVDLITVGRGSYGKPFIFSQIKTYLKYGKKENEKTIHERMNIMRKHIELICDHYGEQKGIKVARSHIIRYLYDIKNAAKLRNIAANIKSLDEFYSFVKDVLDSA